MIVRVNFDLPLLSVQQQAERLYRTSRTMQQMLGTG